MKIFLDDLRSISDVYKNENSFKEWFLCRNYDEFIDYIHNYYDTITHISFDHDISSYDKEGNEYTGYDAVKYLTNYIIDNNLLVNFTVNFHTANQVGYENMSVYWSNFIKFYDKIKI